MLKTQTMSCHLPLGPEKRLLSILSVDITLLKMQTITWKAVTDHNNEVELQIASGSF